MTWSWDASHFPHRVTAALAELWCRPAEVGFAAGCRRYGLGLLGWEVRADDGVVEVRPTADVPRDEWSARERRAAAVLDARTWRSDADGWRTDERPRRRDANARLGAVDLSRLGDDELARHVAEVAALVADGVRRHFELHLADMVPLGRLLVVAAGRGIAPDEVIASTAGRSPASGPEAAPAAWSVVGRLDVDAPTVAECAAPEWTAGAVAHRREADWDDPALDELLDDVAATFWVRDDNATLLLAEPVGLLRSALLEVSARLDLSAIEATASEVVALLRRQDGPDAAELDRRRRRRGRPIIPPVSDAGDPADSGAPPDIGPNSAELTEAFLAYDDLYEARRAHGIGDRAVNGRAVVAATPDLAIERLADDTILVVRTTAPAFDPLLPGLRGLVTELGGPLSHAAVCARELGISAVIGLADATATIEDGASVELDPTTSTVRVR